MRIWTLHPRYLDAKGIVALWREGLLAQRVLAGATRGYRHHPQLLRFRACPEPLAAIATYLEHVAAEAERRGYRFDRSRLSPARLDGTIEETAGQLRCELDHLRRKLAMRSPELLAALAWPAEPHPLFAIVPGPVQLWEKAPPAAAHSRARVT